MARTNRVGAAYIQERCGTITYTAATKQVKAITDCEENAAAWKQLLAERILETLQKDSCTVSLGDVLTWMGFGASNWKGQTTKTGAYWCLVWYFNRLYLKKIEEEK